MSAKKVEIIVGKEAPQADAPQDQEAAQGDMPVFADAGAGDEVAGHSHFRWVTCWACHATNQIGWGVHSFYCWNCHSHVHVY